MKRLISFCFMVLCAMTLFAQKDVTTFLGIPVDGTYSAMRQKLIAKGFKPSKDSGVEELIGDFNGEPVSIIIQTNKDKVFRLIVGDVNKRDEASIKIRYNRLVSQFENNDRYLHGPTQALSSSEDISYEMLIHNKRYQAVYFQMNDFSKIDSSYYQKMAQEHFLDKYTAEQLHNPTDEITDELASYALEFFKDIWSKKTVWFTILEEYGSYYIAMYYENLNNAANGEDL